jgi:putative PIN family toxin of toxin-antitoxin system
MLLISVATVSELDEVLRRPGLNKYVTEEERIALLAALVREAELIAVTRAFAASRDPDDNKFLELALDGYADCIVTGDTDLLELHPFRGISIVSPRDFLADRWKP